MQNLHYCDIATDCGVCIVPFCPHEKLSDDPDWDEMEPLLYADDEDEEDDDYV